MKFDELGTQYKKGPQDGGDLLRVNRSAYRAGTDAGGADGVGAVGETLGAGTAAGDIGRGDVVDVVTVSFVAVRTLSEWL